MEIPTHPANHHAHLKLLGLRNKEYTGNVFQKKFQRP